MHIKSLLVLLAALLISGAVSAKICKSVGPDGTITYTDRPGADACDSQENQSATQSATQSKAGTTPSSAPSAPAVSGVKQPTRKDSAPVATSPTSAAPSAPATSVETAVIGILGTEDLVQRSYEFCIGVLPTSAVRYGNAADDWRDRNMPATTKMRRALLQTFNGPQQKVMIEGVKGRNQRQLDPVVSAPKASQIKWCDQTAGEIENRALDIKDSLIAPLSAY